jgi:hypothetical protein
VSLLRAPVNQFNWNTDNWVATPTWSSQGTSVTAGDSSVEGSYTQVLSALANDCYWISIGALSGHVSTAAHNLAMDVGIDPAGGTSYTAIISDLLIGGAPGSGTAGYVGGARFKFPLFIPSGSTVAVRVQGSNAASVDPRIVVKVWGKPSRPELIHSGAYAETVGTLSSTLGVSFTPGNTVDGTWASLGTTVKDLWYWQLSYQINNATITAQTTYIELAWGDASNKHTILRTQHIGSTDEAIHVALAGNLMDPCYTHVPAGSTIYVRGICSAAPNTGYNALAHGVGG